MSRGSSYLTSSFLLVLFPRLVALVATRHLCYPLVFSFSSSVFRWIFSGGVSGLLLVGLGFWWERKLLVEVLWEVVGAGENGKVKTVDCSLLAEGMRS